MKPALKPLPDFKDLSLEEQVAQMIVVQASGYLFDHQIQYPAWEPPARQLQYWLQELGIGGVILLGGSAGELALRSQQLEKVDHPVASQATLLQLFLRGNAFRGSTGLLPAAEQWFKTLLRNNNLQALIIYGSPYVLEQLLPDLPPTTPYVFSYGQMPQAQAIALEVLFRNHSPD